jgi:hypothetical protein
MFGRIATKLAVWLLGRAAISVEDRNLLTAALLEKVNAFPLRDIITGSESGEILVNGAPLDTDVLVKMRETAKVALENNALKLVWDQMLYRSLLGSVTGVKPEDILFYRTAMWNGEQERRYLRILAGEEQP